MLRDAGTLFQSMDTAETAEQKKKVFLEKRRFSDETIQLRQDVQRFFEEQPRSDFPVYNKTLVNRYLDNDVRIHLDSNL